MNDITIDTMLQQQLTTAVKKRLTLKKASIIGIADLSILADYDYNLSVLKGFSRAVSIGLKLSDDIIDNLIDGPTKEYAAHYTEINAKLDELASDLVVFLNEKGYKSKAIEASKVYDKQTHRANFPHKTAAVLSGIGWIGKNDLLITSDYGPRVRLATVLTTAPLIAGIPQKKSQCGSCMECVKVCPVQCLIGHLWEFGDHREKIFNVHKCSDFIHQQEKIVGKTVCGLCIKVCPFGKP